MELVSPSIGLIFWMTMAFSMVLYILSKYAWKPILKSLKEREATIEGALHAADNARQEMEALKFSNEALLKEAKDERDALMRDARKIRETLIEEAKLKAGEEADRIIESARASIEYEKMAAITELKNQLATLSIEIAERILNEELTKTGKQDEIIKKMLDEVKFN
jgi:F-type H+-transporting ATPase subunit b